MFNNLRKGGIDRDPTNFPHPPPDVADKLPGCLCQALTAAAARVVQRTGDTTHTAPTRPVRVSDDTRLLRLIVVQCVPPLFYLIHPKEGSAASGAL